MAGFSPLQSRIGMAGFPTEARAGVAGKARIGVADFPLEARIVMAGFPLKARTGTAGILSKARTSMAGKARIGMAGSPLQSRIGMAGFPSKARTGMAGKARIGTENFLLEAGVGMAGFLSEARVGMAGFPSKARTEVAGFPSKAITSMAGKAKIGMAGFPLQSRIVMAGKERTGTAGFPSKAKTGMLGFPLHASIGMVAGFLQLEPLPCSFHALKTFLAFALPAVLACFSVLSGFFGAEITPPSGSSLRNLSMDLDKDMPDSDINGLGQSLEDENKPNSDSNGLQQSLQDEDKLCSDSDGLRQSLEDENNPNSDINKLQQSLEDENKSSLDIDRLQQSLEDGNMPNLDSNGLQQSLKEKEHDSDNKGLRLGLERGEHNSAKAWQWKNAVAQLKQETVLDVLSRRALAEKVHLKYTATCLTSSRWEYHLFTNSRNQTLFTQSWRPAPEIGMKAILILLHGLNEHSGRYFSFARQLNLHGYGVFAMDWIGHGGSDGLHGYVDSLDHVVTDMRAFISKVTANNPGVPCFLFGHSTGASIVLKSSLECSMEEVIDGVILTSPALHVRPAHPVFGIIAPLLSLLLPTLQLKGASKRGIPVSRDPVALVNKYTDPLVYTGPIRIRTGSEVLRISAFLHKRMKKVAVPFLVLHGTADTITDPLASLDLYNLAASQHKKINLYEGLLHDLLFEPEREEITCDIIQWVEERLKHRLFHSPCQIRVPDQM